MGEEVTACDCGKCPRYDNGVRQVTQGGFGVGDHLMGLLATAGLQRDDPAAEVVYRCQPAALPWVALFTGYARLVTANAPGVRPSVIPNGGNDRPGPRWVNYANDCGTTPVLPSPRPLPERALAWAERHRGCVALSPWSTWKDRTWPLDRWLRLADLLERAGERCVVLDGPGPRAAAFGRPSACGESPERVAALLLAAKLLVSNDSGLVHLAGLLGAPALALCRARAADIYGCYESVRAVNGGGEAGHLTPEAVCHAALWVFFSGRYEDGFDITPFLAPGDPFVAGTAPERVRRIYREKYAVAKRLQPNSLLEIGVRAGYSAAAFLSACPGLAYHGIDADLEDHGGWPGAPARALAMLRGRFGRDGCVTVADTARLGALPPGPWDLVYVDGDHTYEGCYRDLRLALAAGPRWVLVDDVTLLPDTVGRAARDFVRDLGLRHELLPTCHGDLLITFR